MELIDWAADHGFKIVKLLPINETGSDHSPYNAICSRALEPTTIRTSPEAIEDLDKREYRRLLRPHKVHLQQCATVNYDVVKPLKRKLLESAFAVFNLRHLRRKSGRAR